MLTAIEMGTIVVVTVMAMRGMILGGGSGMNSVFCLTFLCFNVNVILINNPLLYTWVTITWTVEYTKVGSKGELCRGADIAFVFLIRQYAGEQPHVATEHQS